jgi:Beta-propeller repeat/IPT/TIG domain
MKLRLLIATFAFVSIAVSQSLPSYQWIKEVDASAMDSVAGLGTDSQGYIYISGTTSSPRFPVKNAVQPNIASVGLYRMAGTSWGALGLSSCSFLAADPQNPSTLYAVSNGTLLKSMNSGVSFSTTTLPSSHASSIALEPGNDEVLFVGTLDQGVFESTDSGASWTAVNNGLPVQNGQITVQKLWVDPTNANFILAGTPNGIARTADGATSWQLTTITDFSIPYLAFDTGNAGVIYVTTTHQGSLKSTDYGQTFAPFASPTGEVFPDPIQPGRLIAFGGPEGIYQSTDGGATWTQESTAEVADFMADTVNGVYYGVYFSASAAGVARISANLQTVTPLSPTAQPANLGVLAVANGQVYWGYAASNVFVAKLDPSGNMLYSTYFGGSGSDQALAMTVDAAGNVFVAGTTSSADFPVSNNAYATSGGAFLFRLNPDGTLGYSTYSGGAAPVAVATDGSGSAWLLGNLFGVGFLPPSGGVEIEAQATLTRFTPSGSGIVFSTGVPPGGPYSGAGALALAADDSAYVGTDRGLFRIDSSGKLLASMTSPTVAPRAAAFGPDGSLYVAGAPQRGFFQPTPGVFQAAIPPDTNPQAGIIRVDPALSQVLAATYFGSNAVVNAMTIDAGGNVYIAGSTASTGLPTRTLLAGGFASPTGFMSELSGDLSTLLFSSYFGDAESFMVSGLVLGQNGSVIIGGATGQNVTPAMQGDVWLNSLALTPPPALRIDSVENAASLVDGPLSAGETIVVNGAGFGGDAQLTIGGVAISPISVTSTAITAIVPATVPAAAAAVQVQSGGAVSNSVLMPVALTSPGMSLQSGAGYGPGRTGR